MRVSKFSFHKKQPRSENANATTNGGNQILANRKISPNLEQAGIKGKPILKKSPDITRSSSPNMRQAQPPPEIMKFTFRTKQVWNQLGIKFIFAFADAFLV